MSKSPGEMMKSGADGHVFCSLLQFHIWYKALVSYWTEKRTKMSEDADKSVYEGGEGGQV